MPIKRRNFQRSAPHRSYSKTIHIVCEGNETEPAYFKMLKSEYTKVNIQIYPSNHKSNLTQVLNKAKKITRNKKEFKRDDIVTLVVDVDNNTQADFALLTQWCNVEKNRILCISNPCFEYYLLLHFEKGEGIKSKTECEHKLKIHLPNYDKKTLIINCYSVVLKKR